MQCTQCNSDNVQRLSVIYESGTQDVQTTSRTIGGGFGSGYGIGSASTTTTGTSQSYLAQKAAPPSKRLIFPPIALIGLAIVVYLVAPLPFLILLLAISGSIFWFIHSYKYNKNEYPTELQTWSRSWHCNKCGAIYTT